MSALAGYLRLAGDRQRMSAYARALARLAPGAVVADVGSGIGTLSVLAALAGARRVYAIEQRADIAGHVRALAAHNGVADRVELRVGAAAEIDLPERVDLCVYDDLRTLDPAASAAVVADVAKRYLERRGRLVPERVQLWLAAMSSSGDAIAPLPASAGTSGLSVDLAPLVSLAGRQASPVEMRARAALITAPRRVLDARTDRAGTGGFTATGRLRARRGARVAGLLLWPRLVLLPRVVLDAGPNAPRGVYPQLWLPLDRPVSVREGEALRFELGYATPRAHRGHHALWRWRVSTSRFEAGGSTFDSLGLPITGR